MKRIIAAATILAAGTVAWGAEAAPAGSDRPTVEIAFVLDTTGSMGGLIAGAKAKIWQIANQVVTGEPRPNVKIALVPYRDKGDEYVTKVFDLTDDLDEVHKNLMTFQADGGGDGPENVNQALSDAIGKLQWSDSRETMKIIFLVGDCPPHNEYKDVPTYDKLAKSAIEKGIYINTILCGSNGDAAKVWTEIARAAEGKYLQIRQDGGVVAVATPYDKELAGMTGKLNATIVTFGTAGERSRMEAQAEAAAAPSSSLEMQAARNSYLRKAGKSVGSRGDLLDQINNGDVKLADVKKDQLPENMQKMTPKEQEAYVAEKQAERKKVNARIAELSEKRDAYIAKELAKKPKATRGFDYQVVQTLQTQAKKYNIKYATPDVDPEKTPAEEPPAAVEKSEEKK